MRARSAGPFVQVSESLAINMTLVTEITFSEDWIYFYFTPRQEFAPRQESGCEDAPIAIRDGSRLAFLDWWERQAELTQAPQPRYVTFGEW